MTNTSDEQATIRLTESAANKIAELLAEEKKEQVKDNPAELHLRVYVHGGGCSGMQYGFTFDEVQEDDIITEQACSLETKEFHGIDRVKLIVDCFSYQYLAEAEIDYECGMEERFVIRNPNAKTTCGCGSSFSVDGMDD